MAHTATILLVDDDPIMRELASAKLADRGHTVTVAENGAEAFEILEKKPFDLVISDLDMPVMNGFELTEYIRGGEALKETPVIVITASDHEDAVEKAFAAGATSFLAKPINWTLFGHAVQFVLRASRDQKALRAARDQAEAGAKFKDSLMSVMSHELRTPLNAIIGFGQLLGELFEKDNDHLHGEYADYIVDGGKRLLNSVSDMLLASDARSGPIGINEVDCTLGDIVELATAPLTKTIEMADASVKVAVHDPKLELCCDRVLIARAVSKLIDNAIKFSPRGVQIVVGTAIAQSGDAAILIKDNGPGMDAEKLRAAITPFAQSDMSLRRSKEGLGLGLPLAQAIASAHGAKLRLESELGKGTRALLILPARRVRPAAIPAKAAASQ